MAPGRARHCDGGGEQTRVEMEFHDVALLVKSLKGSHSNSDKIAHRKVTLRTVRDTGVISQL